MLCIGRFAFLGGSPGKADDMKVADRDALLARLDERTLNMWRVLDEADDSINKNIALIRKHQEKQNGKIAKNRYALIALMSFLVGTGILEWQDVIHLFGG